MNIPSQTRFSLPFAAPDRLPIRIDPCPVLEAVLEIRFVTEVPWSFLPGLLHPFLRERYPETVKMPLEQIPEDVRRLEPSFTYQPLFRFIGEKFLLQLGPRVISLVTHPEAYPGWAAIREELDWLLNALKNAGFVDEGERLGLRYVDFVPHNLFPHLRINTRIDEDPLPDQPLQISTVFRSPPFGVRLNLTNGAVVGKESRVGSVFDLDVSVGALDFDLFTDGAERFEEAHLLNKTVFFGLLKPEFLATLNPVYL